MSFFCEYCGAKIDAEKYSKCPHCGASFNNNKIYKKLEEERLKEKKINNELKDKMLKYTINTFKFSKFFLIIPIIIFILILIFAVTMIINFNKSNNIPDDQNFFSESNNIINNNNELKVNLGEYAITSNYKVKVTKYELTDSFFKYNYDGYEYITFYLLVENTSNKKITKEDVNCIVDGIAQENDFSSGYSTLPFFISKGLTVQGTATFKVPKTATSYDIRYGDDVIIHVEK